MNIIDIDIRNLYIVQMKPYNNLETIHHTIKISY